MQFRWTDETRRWISKLPEMGNRMMTRTASILGRRAPDLLSQMRAAMPRFEGDMAADLRIAGPTITRDGVRLVFHFSGATVMDADESVDLTTAPFHYPWGKHDGIQPHQVYIYNPRTGRARSKLIRWAKSAGILSGGVPETGDISEVRTGMEPGDPELLTVAPQHVPFIADVLERYASVLVQDLSNVMAISWRG